MNIQSLGICFDVSAAKAELLAHPQLWDIYRWRTEHPRSPHREASDIWMRYNALENMGPHFNEKHESVWYPVCEQLPICRSLAELAIEALGATAIGGVLLTRIPAGKQVYPHVDRGWHAEHYEKIAVQIAGNDRQKFCFDDGYLSPEEGEVYTFNNQSRHCVLNNSDEDRITLICCVTRAH